VFIILDVPRNQHSRVSKHLVGTHLRLQMIASMFQLVMQGGTLGCPWSSIRRTSLSHRDTSSHVRSATSEQLSSPLATGPKRRERKSTLILVHERIRSLAWMRVCVFTPVPTHFFCHCAHKNVMEKSLHVCFVNAVCSGVSGMFTCSVCVCVCVCV